MERNYIEYFSQILIDKFDYYKKEHDSSFDIKKEITLFRNPVTGHTLQADTQQEIQERFLSHFNYRLSHDTANLIPVSVISDPKLHEPWYEQWISENSESQFYWSRLEKFMAKGLIEKEGSVAAGTIVKSIDDATNSILRQLANPKRNEFDYKGLVIGYVQSGKTANFTALIAKAADAGYKLIIVLAGIHNLLRRQTQIRIDKELTGENDSGLEGFIEMPGVAKKWNRLTTSMNDFTKINLSSFASYCQFETPTIAIIKKNVSVLKAISEYIAAANVELRNKQPVLIIDDEADQASIDTKSNDPESDPSKTNEEIRRLLSLFAKKAYVGYTATPFANVLVDMSTDHQTLGDDLYPRNFIVSLPKPLGYFGAANIFQSELSEYFVIEIPNEANDIIKTGEITSNLTQAIDQFLLSCSIRDLRGDINKPMSMLIHISHKIEHMGIVKETVNNYVENLRNDITNQTRNKALKKEFKKQWENLNIGADKIQESLKLKNPNPDFESVWQNTTAVLKAINVLELNSYSEDKIDYNSKEEIKIIAIGGNQLSRGLTLEGLMTSYYLRSSKQYDTLLQMGRWFGYRKGYEDLTRIFTSEQIWDFFEHLSLVEEELRSEVYRYEDEGKTPIELAVTIKGHKNLTVTAKNKMGAGKLKQTSFSNSLNQTTWFTLDQPEILRFNLNLGVAFIADINKTSGFKYVENIGLYVSKKTIPGDKILDQFLYKYRFANKKETGGPGMDSENLQSYIFRRLNDNNPELTSWTVCVATNEISGKSGQTNFGGLVLKNIARSRKLTEKGFNIGVLTDPKHLSVATGKDEWGNDNPLLILYLIDKDSSPKIELTSPLLGQRVKLYHGIHREKLDILGLAIKLPESKFEPHNYFSQ